MQALPQEFNPFALLLDPQAVLAQVEHSERLARLHRRVCRPLDKPMLGALAEDGDDAVDADQTIAMNPAEGRPAASNDEHRVG